jgi:hypothetical protein
MIKAVFLACFKLNALRSAFFTQNVFILSTNYFKHDCLFAIRIGLSPLHLIRIVVECKLCFVKSRMHSVLSKHAQWSVFWLSHGLPS